MKNSYKQNICKQDKDSLNSSSNNSMGIQYSKSTSRNPNNTSPSNMFSSSNILNSNSSNSRIDSSKGHSKGNSSSNRNSRMTIMMMNTMGKKNITMNMGEIIEEASNSSKDAATIIIIRMVLTIDNSKKRNLELGVFSMTLVLIRKQ